MEVALQFLESGAGDVLTLSKKKMAAVSLIRDDEFQDRFFLVVGDSSRPTVRLTISDLNLLRIVDALRQVQTELKGI